MEVDGQFALFADCVAISTIPFQHETINLDALMSSGNLKQMWSGLLHGRFDDFNDINSRLTVNPNLPGEYFLRFPFVAYVVVRSAGPG